MRLVGFKAATVGVAHDRGQAPFGDPASHPAGGLAPQSGSIAGTDRHRTLHPATMNHPNPTLQRLQQAIALHQQGRTAEAERLYREVLKQHRDHPDALHLLGLALLHQGRAEEGMTPLKRAVKRNPKVAEYHTA